MSAKRSACDRCHKMKMQCKTDGRGQQCTRCRTAKVHCNYSEPGRPGRPVTKAGNVMNQKSAADAEPIRGIISPPGRSMADDATWVQATLTESGTVEGSDYYMDDHTTPWTPHGFANSFSATTGVHLDQAESLGALPWPLGISEAETAPSSTLSINQRIHQGSLREIEIVTGQSPLSAMSKANAMRSADRDYTHQLAHFQVKIARMLGYEAHLDPTKLEQEAAHVLESSSEFLELLQGLARIAHGFRGSQQSQPIGPAVCLQVTSISMRLTEMHHWLYSSIHHCLQQADSEMMEESGTNVDGSKPPAELLLFSIAGVKLSPPPQFRLQMLLHTGVHYLHRIQKKLEVLGFDGAPEGSPALPLQTHMLIIEDQRSRMAMIQLVFDKLKEDFGINIIL